VAIFAVGFVSGIFFSAWKLQEFGMGTCPIPPAGPSATVLPEAPTKPQGMKSEPAAAPESLEAFVQLADDYFAAKNYGKALELYGKALELAPGNPDVMTNIAICYRRLGKPQDGVNMLHKALEADPNHAMALFNLGLILRDDLKDYRGALAAWNRFLEKAGSSPHADAMVRPWVKDLSQRLGQEGETPKP